MFFMHKRRYNKLSAQLENDYAHLQQAETVEQYQVVYASAQTNAQVAMEIEAPNLAFRAWTIAASCAVAVAEKLNWGEREQWLVRTFHDLLAACKNREQMLPTEWLFEFATVVMNLYRKSQTQVWLEVPGTEVAHLLHRLAQTVEGFVPIDLTDPQDAERTSVVARWLATLSYGYGTNKSADARSNFAILTAQRAGVVKAWVDALYSRYSHVKNQSRNARTKFYQATSLEDLGAWVEDLARQNEPLSELADLRMKGRDVAEVFRSTFRSRAGRLWSMQHVSHMLNTFFLDEVTAGQSIALLLKAVDNMKARLLLDYLNVPFTEFTPHTDEIQVVKLEQEILQFEPESWQLDKYAELHEGRLTSLLPIGDYAGDLNPFGEEDRQRLQFQLNRLESLYISKQAGFSRASRTHQPSEVGAALTPDEALIEYYIPFDLEEPLEQTVYIFVLTHNRTQVQPIKVKRDSNDQWLSRAFSVGNRQPIEQTPLGDQVISLRMAIENGNDEAAYYYLENLYNVLINPIVQLGLLPTDFKRWIIVPHAMLHAIPFGALRSPNKRYLIQDVALTITPSASVWLNLQRRAPSAVTNFIGFANPLLLDAKWSPLPQAEEEVAQIADLLKPLKCSIYIAEDATEAAVHENVSGKSIVHFATHGDFPESDVIDLHQILLAASTESDGRLHAAELRRMDLDSARLVTLSICNGGLYRIGPGDEPYGLIPALFIAGAENVIATLWQIEDQSGRAFMLEFYKHVLNHGPAEAWRRSCVEFLQNHRSLRDWAAWTLTGSGRPWID